jgi:hypothetical protein
MKEKVIEILKSFEQQDYKRGGVSIAPEMYSAIADRICAELINPEIFAKEHFRKQRDEGLVEDFNNDSEIIKFTEFCRDKARIQGTYAGGFTGNWELVGEQKIVTTKDLLELFRNKKTWGE